MKTLLLLLLISMSAPAQNVSIYDPVRESMSEVRELATQAYEELLEKTPGVSGTLDVTFVLRTDGTVCDVSVRGSEGLDRIAGTLAEAVAGLSLPPLPEGTGPLTISVPFVFTPPTD
jgi:TonB family protein